MIRTPRLTLREFTADDDEFIVSLLNEPAFLRFIGDKGVRTAADARVYLERGPMDSYVRHRYGLLAVCLPTGEPVGMCGLVRREGLDHPDLGFAFRARYWGQGFAVESATAVLNHAFGELRLPRLVAITSLDNEGSIAVLNKVGFNFERVILWGPQGEPIRLFGIDAPAVAA